MIKQLLSLALMLAALCVVPSVTEAQRGRTNWNRGNARVMNHERAPVVIPPRDRVVVAPPRVTPAAPPVLVHLPPPPPRAYHRPMAPRWRQAVWIDGYWRWSGDRYTWIQGRWVRPHRGFAWIQPRWEERDEGWVMVPGRWMRVR
jgi:hypothetical protein